MADPKKKKTDFSNAWAEARDIVWRHRKRLLLGLGLMLINRPAGLVLPYSTKFFIDRVIPDRDMELLTLIVIAGAVATVIQSITSFALAQVLGVAAQRAIMDMRKTVQQHVTRLPTSFFDSTKSGVLISRIMSDAEGIRNLVGTGLIQIVGGLLTAAVCLGYLFVLNWMLTSFVILVLGVFGGGMAYAFNTLRPLFRTRGELNAIVTGRLAESLGGIRVVKAYTAEKREDIVFAHGIHNLFRNVAKSMTGVSAIGAFSTVVVGAIGITIMLIGGQSIMNGEMTIGELFNYILFTGLVVAPLVNMANIGTQITEAFAGLDRIREIRRMATEGEDEDGLDPLDGLQGEIRFEDVVFEYEPGKPVLKGVSFEAPAGATTALVGSSGSGKSTLIGLVMAFHYPKSGRILVDGRDLHSVRLSDYRSRLGVVLQDNFLFEGTIAENIRYSCPNATEHQVREAAQIAHCTEFIDSFEQGFQTIVGERGVKLSGGQRQRVAIARAILADPRILILDEATSSLDSESEALIQDGLNSLRLGRTTFVIAHRLSTIRSAEQILVIEGGLIVERGSHAELLALDGRYKQLYDKQYKFEMNRFINPGEEFVLETTA